MKGFVVLLLLSGVAICNGLTGQKPRPRAVQSSGAEVSSGDEGETIGEAGKAMREVFERVKSKLGPACLKVFKKCANDPEQSKCDVCKEQINTILANMKLHDLEP